MRDEPELDKNDEHNELIAWEWELKTGSHCKSCGHPGIRTRFIRGFTFGNVISSNTEILILIAPKCPFP